MMETRVQREVERSKSVLYKTRGFGGMNGAGVGGGEGDAAKAGTGAGAGGVESWGKRSGLDREREREVEASLSPEQLQLFAQENNDMLRHYEDTLDQVR
jgi:outer membrane lipoprotein SlyB